MKQNELAKAKGTYGFFVDYASTLLEIPVFRQMDNMVALPNSHSARHSAVLAQKKSSLWSFFFAYKIKTNYHKYQKVIQ